MTIHREPPAGSGKRRSCASCGRYEYASDPQSTLCACCCRCRDCDCEVAEATQPAPDPADWCRVVDEQLQTLRGAAADIDPVSIEARLQKLETDYAELRGQCEALNNRADLSRDLAIKAAGLILELTNSLDKVWERVT